MSTHTNTELDVNVLMTQIRETAAAPKPAPQPSRQHNNSNDASRLDPKSQESFNQRTIGILQQFSTISDSHQHGLVQLQQNAILQNAQILGQNQRINEQAELVKRLTEKIQPVYLGKGRLFVKTADGLPLIVRADDLQITAALVTEGTWDRPLTKIFQRFIKNDMAYLEIGTHIGYFTTLAAALVAHRGKIHAFEPNPVSFEFLESNMVLNRCGYLSKLVPQATSNRTGKTTFHVFAKNSGNSTLSELPGQLLDEWCERPTEVEVNCTTLDDFYANETLQFDFIKIDAEGAEPLIFEGGRNFFQNRTKLATIIAMEFNPPAILGLKHEPKTFAKNLFDAGFKLWRIVGEDDFQPVTSPDQLDAWCITELLMSRSENLPA